MSVFYVDPIHGSDEYNGSAPELAVKNYRVLKVLAGDSVLFRRGSIIRDYLDTVAGRADAPTVYGAWGEGERPVFIVSADISSPDLWTAEGGGVWSCDYGFSGDIGNLIFNGSECSATLRWEKSGLSGLGDFYDEAFGCGAHRPKGAKLYLFSGDNPGTVFSSIEAAQYGKYCNTRGNSYTVYEDLEFVNSGVHAFQGSCVGVTMRRCAFRRIGGCVWSKELRIRFGNCVEFWDVGDDILIEDCVFENVYDSCVTHQGGADVKTAQNFVCRRNSFDTYGMAAFEYRDRLPINSSFTDNICENAGCGFAMLGEDLPRRSEIWPQPMGHHIFLWRIDSPSEDSSLLISGNRFGAAPVGSVVYSIISPEAEKRIRFEENEYTSEPKASVFYGGAHFENGEDWEKTL
ncbi:MAG: hypothetical protein IIX84_05930 [Oscillospiraceae bacterium]|nr:hypothetical protein [Oscillospiraceae bacterium]